MFTYNEIIKIFGEAGYTIEKMSMVGSLDGENEKLADELVSFVATDAHRDSGRAPYMNEAAAYLRRKYDPLYVRAILYDNAEKVIYDEEGIE